jgi:hypothetical protein
MICRAAAAKGRPLKPASRKSWLERLEDFIFGEEDPLCDSAEDSASIATSDEGVCADDGLLDEECQEATDDDGVCDELDAILRARRCKDPCSDDADKNGIYAPLQHQRLLITVQYNMGPFEQRSSSEYFSRAK